MWSESAQQRARRRARRSTKRFGRPGHGAHQLVADSPAFGCYLIALAVLPLRWLSPIGSLYEHADWTDILVGIAAALWLFEKLRARQLAHALRLWQLPLLGYLALACVSATVALPGRGGSFKTVLLMAELAVLAVITADFASAPDRRRVIARVIVASSIGTVALGALGLILFYARVPNGLIGAYGDLTPSHLYARIQAGFESPDLLASYCIFASGITASRDAALRPRLRMATQISLGLLCAATLSRGLIAFLFAVVMRRCAAMSGRRRWIIPTAAAAVSVGVIAVLTVGGDHLDLVKPSTISTAFSGSSPRRAAFVTSLKTFEHHPLFGIGPGALPGLNNDGIAFRPHFTPLNVAATLGLPALCALVAMLVLLWRTRRRPTDVALWSALGGIAIDGLAQDIDHFRHVWVLLGLLGSGPESAPAGGRVETGSAEPSAAPIAHCTPAPLYLYSRTELDRARSVFDQEGFERVLPA